jgi:hypothetical protein
MRLMPRSEGVWSEATMGDCGCQPARKGQTARVVKMGIFVTLDEDFLAQWHLLETRGNAVF